MVDERLYQTIIDAIDMGYDITIGHTPYMRAYMIKVTERETDKQCLRCIKEEDLKHYRYSEEICREIIIQNIATIQMSN